MQGQHDSPRAPPRSHARMRQCIHGSGDLLWGLHAPICFSLRCRRPQCATRPASKLLLVSTGRRLHPGFTLWATLWPLQATAGSAPLINGRRTSRNAAHVTIIFGRLVAHSHLHLPYPRFYLVLASIGPFTDFMLIVWTPR